MTQRNQAIYTDTRGYYGSNAEKIPVINAQVLKDFLSFEIKECPMGYYETQTNNPNNLPAMPGQDIPLNTVTSLRHTDLQKVWTRSDNGAYLGAVNAAEKIVQPRELVDMINPLTEQGLATFDGCQVNYLPNLGLEIQFTLKLNGAEVEIVRGDKELGFWIYRHTFKNGGTGSGAASSFRPTCDNMRAQLLSEMAKDDERFSFRTSRQGDLNEAIRAMMGGCAIAQKVFQKNAERAKALASRKIRTQQELESLIKDFFKVKRPDTPTKHLQIAAETGQVIDIPKAYDRVMELVSHGRGTENEAVKGTYWGAYNAFSEWTDHERPRNADTGLRAKLWGDAAADKRAAFKRCEEYAGLVH